ATSSRKRCQGTCCGSSGNHTPQESGAEPTRMRSSATAMSGLSFRCCGGGGRDGAVPGQFLGVDAADLRQLVLEGGQFGAARHVVGEFLQADLAAGRG